jgi:hypothetical protein
MMESDESKMSDVDQEFGKKRNGQQHNSISITIITGKMMWPS